MPHATHPGAALSIALLLCASLPVLGEDFKLRGVRHSTQGSVTRVAVELDGQPEIRRDRLTKPDRYFFDFQQTSSGIRGMETIAVGNALLRQVRIATPRPGVARVVLDLAAPASVSTSELSNPYRFVIEVRPPTGAPEPVRSAAPPPPSKALRAFVPPKAAAAPKRTVTLTTPPSLPLAAAARIQALPILFRPNFPPFRQQTAAQTLPPPKPVAVPAPAPALGAARSANGANSMTRALGLKIRRVVVDAGHGGHDQGSAGPTGLLEKELVLDVALRLGELITSTLGAEVVYTRTDDHFIPLESRTKIANDSKADLFVSIHANSSPIRAISGVETYYLSFTNSKEALDVAARENATSDRSVFELRDLLQKIALQDKIEESRDFAGRVNAALFRVWPPSPSTRNRGVKKAPFVVLIGASMPSILTEIGFLSNPRDEKELRKPETRQKIAEGLLKGISQYADSLSHFAAVRGSNE